MPDAAMLKRLAEEPVMNEMCACTRIHRVYIYKYVYTCIRVYIHMTSTYVIYVIYIYNIYNIYIYILYYIYYIYILITVK